MTTRKHETSYAMHEGQDMGDRVFSCKNCGRIHHTTHPKKAFCNKMCKNMYHSRGIRRISRLEKRVEALEKDRPIPQAKLGNGI